MPCSSWTATLLEQLWNNILSPEGVLNIQRLPNHYQFFTVSHETLFVPKRAGNLNFGLATCSFQITNTHSAMVYWIFPGHLGILFFSSGRCPQLLIIASSIFLPLLLNAVVMAYLLAVKVQRLTLPKVI